MILVAGGTGRLGSLLVTRFAERGQDVRVLTRDASRAGHLRGSATEVVVGDVRDPDSLEHAVRGIDLVVSAVQGFAGPGRVTPTSVDDRGNAHLIDAAAAAGADVVLVSVVGASSDSPMELFRAKHAAEQHLRHSTVSGTIVRATAFVELWAHIMAKPIVFGRGDNPINFVSVADVADVAALAALDPSLRGQIVEVGGPQNLTFKELAALLRDIRGDRGKVRHIPRWLLHAAAPFSRQPRAALTMDRIDMTFDSPDGHVPLTAQPLIDARTALTRMLTEDQPHESRR